MNYRAGHVPRWGLQASAVCVDRAGAKPSTAPAPADCMEKCFSVASVSMLSPIPPVSPNPQWTTTVIHRSTSIIQLWAALRRHLGLSGVWPLALA
jgi:hypothetical protein